LNLLEKVGDTLQGGDLIGVVIEHALEHRIMVPPDNSGIVCFIAPIGEYTILVLAHHIPLITKETILALEKPETKKYSMLQQWSIRKPRPVCEKLVPGIAFSNS
jgi:vacuolar-type H+-ATPase catalytic subunit A/Vma1